MADATVKRTGVIGLGAMGLQMARHMVRKGFEVAGYDVDSEAAKKAASHGVRVCGSVAEVGKHAEVVMIMVANFESLTFAKKLGVDIPRLIEALGHGSGANWSLSRWGKSTGKWAEKDMDVALELAQDAKMPMPLAGLVDQLVKHINQDKMKALLS